MTIANRIGRTSFAMGLAGLLAGTPQGDGRDYPFRCALLPQITTIPITGFGADTDSVALSITLPNGVDVSGAGLTVTRASAVPVDNAAAATALAALVNGHASLRGHVVGSVSGDSLVLTFQHANIVYPVSTTVVGCTATPSTTQAAGGSAIPIARFVARGAVVGGTPVGRGAPALAALTAASTAAQIAGVVLRRNLLPNGESALSSAVDAVPVGKMADVRAEGPVAMLNSGGDAAAGGQVHVVISTAGGDEIGEARGSAAGATAEVWTVTPTAAEVDFLLQVEWTQTDGTVQIVPLLAANPDGSNSATEICNAWRAAVAEAQADGLLAGFSTSGTTTFVLTGPAGQSFVVRSIGEGASAAVETTPAVPYTVALPLARAVWVDETPAGSVGTVMLRMI